MPGRRKYERGTPVGSRYRLIERVGTGGMADVWRAQDTLLGRERAVKFSTVSGPKASQRAERFLREARLAASVHHRMVVRVTDYGLMPDGQPYIVMDLLEGNTLAHYLARGHPMRVSRVRRLFDLLLSGLGAVHDAGIVHRDLKPENVVLVHDADGWLPKLTDFGVSRAVEDEMRSPVTTRQGLILGTPHYMSPEQARGHLNVDLRSDLFSVGVMLYECLSGRLPFDADTPVDVLFEVIRTEAPPLTLHGYGPALSGVVQRAMAKEPSDRFASSREMRVALAAARSRERERRRVHTPRDSRVRRAAVDVDTVDADVESVEDTG